MTIIFYFDLLQKKLSELENLLTHGLIKSSTNTTDQQTLIPNETISSKEEQTIDDNGIIF